MRKFFFLENYRKKHYPLTNIKGQICAQAFIEEFYEKQIDVKHVIRPKLLIFAISMYIIIFLSTSPNTLPVVVGGGLPNPPSDR